MTPPRGAFCTRPAVRDVMGVRRRAVTGAEAIAAIVLSCWRCFVWVRVAWRVRGEVKKALERATSLHQEIRSWEIVLLSLPRKRKQSPKKTFFWVHGSTAKTPKKEKRKAREKKGSGWPKGETEGKLKFGAQRKTVCAPVCVCVCARVCARCRRRVLDGV